MPQSENAVQAQYYQVTISPDIARLDFAGNLYAVFQAGQPVSGIRLNSLDLAIRQCECRMAEKWIPCRFAVDPEKETLEMDLPAPLEGPIEIRINYYGRINQQMAGFYRSAYRRGEQTEIIAVTQFQESDARRAFPCMDHPRFKARFDICLVIDRDMAAVGNMPIASETHENGGKKQVVFEKTPVMSTYLLFFGVGLFCRITDELDRRVRAAILPGMESAVQYGLAFARKALNYCETYYQIPYPLPKLDLIAVPDFAFGAMENWGAITFRENLLLYDPQHTAVDGEERICEVIAHEIVHQWFGNLVTPEDWKFLWLNESFATYFAYRVVDAYHPDWQVWDEFLESQTAPAIARDGLSETTSIEIPGGSHVVINSATAPIIYSKGGSILRQIEGYVGQEQFQGALQHFLSAHAYGCAGSTDLWDSMESESGLPVRHIMKGWITQPGHPLVCAERRGQEIVLTQQRFTYLPVSAPYDQTWPIPVSMRFYDENGACREENFIFENPETGIKLDPDVRAYKINAMHTGFYRVWYQDPKNLERLGEMAADAILPEIDRWGLENDLFALAVSSRIPLTAYLDFLSYFETEAASLPVSGKMAHLHDLMLITEGGARKTVSAAAALHLTAALNRVGHAPEAEEPHGKSKLRNLLFWQAALHNITGTVEAAQARFEQLQGGRKINPDILRGVMQVGAHTGDEKTFSWLVDRMESAESEQDRINCLRALGCFSDPGLIQQALSYIMEKVPDRNKFIPIAQLARNPAATGHMWDWYVNHAPALNSIHPIIHERIIAAIVPVCGLEQAESVTAWFEAELRQDPPAKDAIRMSLEKLDINHRLRGQAFASFA
ncbi:MAG: M1 family metallopeptidase [Desulfobacterales bacterium]